MKTVVNQLNKVKLSNTNDIEAESASEFILSVLNNEESLNDKSIVVLNSESGILHVGISLLQPREMCSVIQSSLSDTLKANICTFNVCCDFILSRSCPFKHQSMDVAVIGPMTDKSKYTDLSYVEISTKMAKTVYCMFKSEHKQVLLNKFTNASILGVMKIKNLISSKCDKKNEIYTEYTIFKVSEVL